MRILFATSELYPLIKTGGLADISFSLPVALKSLGHDVKIVIPFYRSIKEKINPETCLYKGKIFGYLGDISLFSTTISTGELFDNSSTNTSLNVASTSDKMKQDITRQGISKLEVLLVDAPSLFDRDGGPYVDARNCPWGDSAYRFTVFSRVVAMLGNNQLGLNCQPDIVHCNDWQTGLVVPLLKLEPNPPASIFTIHNLAYQGNFSKAEYDHLLLPEDWWSIEGLEFYGECSFLKAGIMHADWVTTVSPTYANEVQTPEFGERFEGILQHRKAHFVGILNGADYSQWSPQKDPFISTHFGPNKISLKRPNKIALQQKLELPVSEDIPIFGMICRMAYQKGVDLVIEALPELLKNKIQVVVLGSGDIYYEAAFKLLQRQFPDRLSVTVGYDEVLAHQIEAGADFFLMPSRYEPCGLNQIYSLSYGTLPIVRNTGGLADTVTDTNDLTISANDATGFVFEQAEAGELTKTVKRALSLYRDKKTLMQVRLTAMAKDFSWDKSSHEYEKLYRLAVHNGKKNKKPIIT